jgi:hypothetical protein
MGLYLCVYGDDDEEIDGVEVGSYADFGAFRDAVARLAPDEQSARNRFPVLLDHSDCDGEWAVEQLPDLERELQRIIADFKRLPATVPNEGWQRQVAKQLGLNPADLSQSFFDVDGEPLLERLLELCDVAKSAGRPITFQ